MPSETLVPFYTGHALGNLTVTPLALLVARRKCARLRRRRRVETARWKALCCSRLVAATTIIGVYPAGTCRCCSCRSCRSSWSPSALGGPARRWRSSLLAVIGGGATLFGIGPIELLDGQPGADAIFPILPRGDGANRACRSPRTSKIAAGCTATCASASNATACSPSIRPTSCCTWIAMRASATSRHRS